MELQPMIPDLIESKREQPPLPGLPRQCFEERWARWRYCGFGDKRCHACGQPSTTGFRACLECIEEGIFSLRDGRPTGISDRGAYLIRNVMASQQGNSIL